MRRAILPNFLTRCRRHPRRCTKCVGRREAFVAAAASAALKPAFFGAVDVLAQPSLRKKLGAKCSYECAHLAWRRDEPDDLPVTVAARSNWEKDALVTELTAYLRPPVQFLASAADVAAFAAAAAADGADGAADAPARVLGVEAGASFDALARSHRAAGFAFAKVPSLKSGWFGSTSDDDPAAGVHLWRASAQEAERQRVSLPAAEMATTNLSLWVQSRALDDLIDYTWEQRTKVEGLGLAVLQVFCDRPPDAETNATLRAVAAAHKGSVALMVFRTETSSYMMEDYGFAADSPMPRLGVSPSFEYDAPKYAYAGELAAAPIIAYVASFLGGELRPTLKSADAPTEAWTPGTTRVVVGSTLRSEVVESEDDVLIAFHAPYGFDEVNATLARLARLAVSAAPALKIATFNTMSNAFEPALFPGVDKYHADPIVMVWSGKGEGRSMKRLIKGKPTLKTLLPFAKKHSPALKSHWDTVKAALDDDNKRIADEKAKVKAEAAAKLVELQAQAAAAEVEELCCDGDGGITKKVLVAGSGETPTKGARVKAHYTGRVSTTCVAEGQFAGECAPAAAHFEGEQFDSSRHGFGGEPFEFTLGEGQVIRGWDEGFATMKPGERALLTIKAEYAYGDAGSPPKIPPQATLEFDVELIGADVLKDEM